MQDQAVVKKEPARTSLAKSLGLTIAQLDALQEIAHREQIPVTGLTILGGKPYINVTGLDVKMKNKCRADKLIHTGTTYICITEATKENGMHAGGWGLVTFFDRDGFERALKAICAKAPPALDVLQTLTELYTHEFKMRGWASPETLQMQSMKNKDNIEAMAERRATNRAKREAVGTGLTSIDEIDVDLEVVVQDHNDDTEKLEAVNGMLDISARTVKMFEAFNAMGIGRERVLAYLAKSNITERTIDAQTLDNLTGLYALLREGKGDASKLFPEEQAAPKPPEKSITATIFSVRIKTCKTEKMLEKIISDIETAYGKREITKDEAQTLIDQSSARAKEVKS